MLSEMLDALSRADRATARHCAAVARYARDLCQAAGGTEAEQQLVHAAGLLHDVGKVTFPEHIFTGQTRLLVPRAGAGGAEPGAVARGRPALPAARGEPLWGTAIAA